MSEAASLMLLSMVTLIIWFLIITWWLGIRRTQATNSKDVSMKYYQVYQGDGETGQLAQHTRHHINLLELPLVFYVMVVTIVATGLADMTFAYLAWGFVASRFVHSLVHLSYNNVIHRFAAYGTGLILLSVITVRLFLVLL